MKNNTGYHNNKFAGFYIALVVCFFVFNILSVNVHADNVMQATNIKTPDIKTTEAKPTVVEANSAAAVVTPTAIQTTSPINAYKPTLPATQKPSTTSQLANLLGGLALILLLIYGLSWFVKRFSQGGFMQNSTIKMLSAMPLGTRERLMLVDVGGKQMLLGVTATQINTLHVFDEPVMHAEKNNQTSSQAPSASDFSQKLMAILQQKNLGKAQPSEHKNIKE